MACSSKASGLASSLVAPGPRWPSVALDQLFKPVAVTLVGASPKSHVTEVLLANFSRADRPFPGQVNLVNSHRKEVLGHDVVPSVADVSGDLGLVYLLLNAEATVDVVAAMADGRLGERISGLVAYAAGYAESGNLAAQARLVHHARRLGVPLLGPQSTGVVSASAGLVGITDPVPERYLDGRIGLIAQSTGLLGGALSWLFRRGLGVGKAVGSGNGADLDYTDLAPALLRDPEIDVVAIYLDAVMDISGIVRVGIAARAACKPVAVHVGAWAPGARRAAESHSGSLATNANAVKGVAEQFGVLLVDTFDELLWAVGLLEAGSGASKFVAHSDRVSAGIFTASGGGGIIAAETLERAQVRLAELGTRTKAALGLGAEESGNPLDVGAISLDRPEALRSALTEFVSDPDVTVVVNPSSLGAPSHQLPSHRRSLDAFVACVAAAGKLPVVAYPFVEDERDYGGIVDTGNVLVVGGAKELGGKLRLLERLIELRRRHSDADASSEVHLAASARGRSSQRGDLVDAERALRILEPVGVSVPAWVRTSGSENIARLLSAQGWESRALVAKTAALLPHRAKAGGIVLGVTGNVQVEAAIRLLEDRFDSPVDLSEQIEFEVACFVGLQVDELGRPLMLFGHGVADEDSSVSVRLCPLTMAEARRLAGGVAGDNLARLMVALSYLPIRHELLAGVDINPLVVDKSGALIALDVKVYVAAGSIPREGE